MSKLSGGGSLPPRPGLIPLARGFVGGFVSIFCLALLSTLTEHQFLMAPFGATCVILFAASALPVAQPRNVVGGHVLSALVGFAGYYLFLDGSMDTSITGVFSKPDPILVAVAMAVSVGVAIAAMQFLRVVHPPAGANPLVIIMAGTAGHMPGFDFMVFPVLLGSILLVGIAAFINNVGEGQKWPVYWHGMGQKRD
ncbi:MAG: CBS-domain-containing membrane protein [Alteromonadaceae bacterium]|jgi:CBS-domain-containing membrane protein